MAVDGADLLNQDPSRITRDLRLGSEGRRSSAARGRRHDYSRPWQKFVSLDDNAEAVAVLLLPSASGKAEPEDVTSAHEEFPSVGFVFILQIDPDPATFPQSVYFAPSSISDAAVRRFAADYYPDGHYCSQAGFTARACG